MRIDDYIKKLKGLGIEASREEMYTTAVAAIEYLKIHMPEAKRLFVLGTPSMIFFKPGGRHRRNITVYRIHNHCRF